MVVACVELGAISSVAITCNGLTCGAEVVAVDVVEVEVAGVVVASSELACGELVESVKGAVTGVVVACPEPVEGAVAGVLEAAGMVVIVVVVEVVTIGEVAVGGTNEGVEVAEEPSGSVSAESMTSGIVSTGSSGIVVDPRCLLSHSATAVTPSCQES